MEITQEQLANLTRYARKLTRDPVTAEDLTQHTLLRALLYKDSFTPGTNLMAWLRKIMFCAYMTRLEKKKKQRRDQVRSEPLFQTSIPSNQIDSVLLKEVLRFIGTFPPAQAATLLVTAYGVSSVPLAKKIGTSAITLRTRTIRARHALKQHFQ